MGKRIMSIADFESRADPVDPSSAVISLGNFDVRDLPESGSVIADDAITVTLVWGGTYAALLVAQPTKGSVYTEYPNLPVQYSTLVRRPGNLGQLTIVLSNRVEEEGEAAKELTVRWEIEWARIEKELVQHPYIADDASAAQIVEDLNLWQDGESKLRAQYKFKDPSGAEKTLIGKALEAATKMLRGQESYVIFAPSLRRVREYQGRPDAAACGFIDTPEVAIAGYEYLKTGDRLSQQGNDLWQRTEEWSGADSWDTDFYSAGAGWNAAPGGGA